jgi:thioredoxin-related protein
MHLRIFHCSLVAMLALIVSCPVSAEPPAGYPFVSFDVGLKSAAASGKPVFVYFGRYGCGWCDKTNKEAFSSQKVRAAYTANYELVYVDAESGKRLTLPDGERITERELGVRFRAFATPLFAFLHPDGKKIMQIAGIQSERDLLDYHHYVHGGLYKTMDLSTYLGTRKP